jgi:urea transport system permease protein
MVNWAKTSISEQFPSGWLYLQGLLFVVVILFLPKGVGGGLADLRAFVRARMPSRTTPRIAAPPVPAAAAAKKVKEVT